MLLSFVNLQRRHEILKRRTFLAEKLDKNSSEYSLREKFSDDYMNDNNASFILCIINVQGLNIYIMIRLPLFFFPQGIY